MRKTGLTQRSLIRASKECDLPCWFIARFLRRCCDSHGLLPRSVWCTYLSSLPQRNEKKKHGNCFMPARPSQNPFSRSPASSDGSELSFTLVIPSMHLFRFVSRYASLGAKMERVCLNKTRKSPRGMMSNNAKFQSKGDAVYNVC